MQEEREHGRKASGRFWVGKIWAHPREGLNHCIQCALVTLQLQMLDVKGILVIAQGTPVPPFHGCRI